MSEADEALLELKNVHVSVGEQEVLHGVDLSVGEGKIHVLFGANGSGKSSLLSSVMGLPPFRVTEGKILFRGEPIDGLAIDERARLGIGMAFQRPPSLDGVSVDDFKAALGVPSSLFATEAAALDFTDFTDRGLNVGFSGGEIKRWEVLKLFLQAPTLMLFDEPESGVDLEHIAAIGNAIKRLSRSKDAKGRQRSALIITHTGLILDYVDADMGHIMSGGRIIHSGAPRELFRHIQAHGYRAPVS